MNFYSITVDNKIIAVANSDDFKVLQRKPRVFLQASEGNGQYILVGNTFYRDYWMAPTVDNTAFVQSTIEKITENEYNNLFAAFSANNNIEEELAQELLIREEEMAQEIAQQISSAPDPRLETLRALKLKELSYNCQKTIENGFDLNGEHFSLTTQDQLNLIMLSDMVNKGMNEIPYHADNNLGKFYTAAEANEIITEANNFRLYHINYFNSLKNYVNSLSTGDEIENITYGIEIPEEYQTAVFKTFDF